MVPLTVGNLKVAALNTGFPSRFGSLDSTTQYGSKIIVDHREDELDTKLWCRLSSAPSRQRIVVP